MWMESLWAYFISSGDLSIFQRFFCFALCTDKKQKSETIGCTLNGGYYDKLTGKSNKKKWWWWLLLTFLNR